MPPPQHFLSNRLRGYVCKSCLSKLRAPWRQQLPLTLRTFATDDRPKKGKGAWDLPHGTVRYFEQTPDGVRTEIKDNEDDAFTESLRKHLQILEERTGKGVNDLEEEDLQNLLRATLVDAQGEDALGEPFGDPSLDPQAQAELKKALEAMTAQDEEMKSQIEFINSFDLNNLSDQDRSRLREELLKSVKKDKLPESQSETPVSEGGKLSVQARALTLPIASFSPKDHKNLQALEKWVNNNTTRKALKRPLLRRPGTKKHISNTDVRIRETWRAYVMCRNALIFSPHLVSTRFWTALWNVLSKDDLYNLDRMSHLKVLGDDMFKSGISMDQAQKLLYIEATFIEADQSGAIQTWESMGSSGMDDRKEYWDLGTRMFCRHGLIDRAVSCAGKILDNTNDPNDFRLLLPIIGAVLKSDKESCIQRAWALYIRLRFNLGRNITMEDYDSLVTMFMNTDHRDQALAIFKDMMLTDNANGFDRDSITRYTKSVGKFAILSSLNIHTTELDWQDFSTVDILPQRLNNRIFFASWMKKLIGDGELDSAEKVYYIMQERGIRPTSISMNGLIGAWYRRGSQKYREKADALAWQMIKERQDVVALRERTYRPEFLEGPVHLVMTEDKPGSKPVTWMPYATIETFAIMLKQYVNRQQFLRIPALFEALESAKIKPNTSFMNQLLLTNMKAQSLDWAMETYRSLTDLDKPKGSIVQPDFNTYQILWENLARAYDPIRLPGRKSHLLGNSRSMFSDMMRHLKSQGGPLPNELYQTIILCFCMQKDQIGTAVALKGLQMVFGNFPTEVTARAIVLQIARTGLKNESGIAAPRRLDTKSEVTRKRIQSVTQALGLLRDRRAETLRKQGIDPDGLEGDAKLEETLLILSQLLRYGFEHKPTEGITPEAASEARRLAALQMDVPECVLWEGEDV